MLKLKEEALQELQKLNKEADVLNCKAKYLGKKSELNELLSSLKNLSVEEKKEMGPLLNQTKKELEEAFSKKLEEIHYILKNIVTLKNIIYSNIYISNYEFFFHKRKHKN